MGQWRRSSQIKVPQSDGLGITLSKLGSESSSLAKLSGTHWRKIGGVGEEDTPLVAHPFVELDGTFRCFRLKSGTVSPMRKNPILRSEVMKKMKWRNGIG